ncbi:mitochondrial septum site-determining protein MinE [Andalucia godoyi]|uniref:Mitochondrial MinE n=1 Tax=Andalucia godoyi TaxID=505711 RepID=A0A0E3X1K9_ANDGO|nr:mitochondrial MinE [Andalucia godoyi]KAF0852923.1 mitochondrial septum site-determining protein MinE [Andalucia godoyi]|eukprot:AKB90673.1 mitochondrial septum site-determining protein MinE
MSFLNRILNNVSKSFPGSVTQVSVPETRSIARERLHIILSRERASNRLAHVDIPALQRDLLATVQKYVPVSTNEVTISVKKEGVLDVFEMQVVLADGSVPITLRTESNAGEMSHAPISEPANAPRAPRRVTRKKAVPVDSEVAVA